MDEERLCSIINLYNSMDDSAKEYIGVTDIYICYFRTKWYRILK